MDKGYPIQKYMNYWKSMVIQFISDWEEKKEGLAEGYQNTEPDDRLLKEQIHRWTGLDDCS